MMKNLLLNRLCLSVLALLSASAWGQVITFNYTGTMQTYVVPTGVTSMQMELYGASGYGTLGYGGKVEAVIDVTPGETLNIFVGGTGTATTGGFNGGGVPGSNADYGGGGGASDVRSGGAGLANRIIVAGGGGGSGSNCGLWTAEGGHGGGLTGESGCLYSCSDCQYTGAGGSQVAGGIAGPTAHGSCGGNNNGALGLGGSNTIGGYGTGGGGGYYGGGSGCFEGAGGGSSYTEPGAEDVVHTVGVRDGDGQVILTILCTSLTVTVSESSICFGDEVTLDAESGGGGDITWDGGVENGVPFTPDMVGFIDYTAISSDPGDCDAVVTIVVYALPTVTATTEATLVCLGDEITLVGSGATSYSWDHGVTNGVPFTPELGTTTYTVTGTSGPGCEDTDEITITVLETPEVNATASDDLLCFGESLILTGTGADIYEWSPDGIENGVSFVPDETGTIWYHVIGYNSFGCSETDSVAVTMNEEIVITYTTEDAITGTDGSIDITVTGGVAPYTFDWDNDGTGDFDDDEDLTGLEAGTYTVIVKDDSGCTGTAVITVNSQVGIADNTKNSVLIYPNPTTGFVVIEHPGTFNYEVTDISGSLILKANGNDKEYLSLTNLANGIYFITIKANDMINTVKIIKE